MENNHTMNIEKIDIIRSPFISSAISTIEYNFEKVDFLQLIGNTDTLDCSTKEISMEELGRFLTTHSNVTKVNLSKCAIDGIKLSKLLNKFPLAFNDLESLDLSFNHIYDMGLKELICYFRCLPLENNKLTHLNLSNCQLDDEGYSKLLLTAEAIFPNLTTLDLSKNQISNTAAKYTLHRVSDHFMLKLELLDLSDNPISEDTLQNLQKIMVYNGYPCKVDKSLTADNLENIFNELFNDHPAENIEYPIITSIGENTNAGEGDLV